MDFAEVGQELAEGLAADPDAGVAWRHGWEKGTPETLPTGDDIPGQRASTRLTRGAIRSGTPSRRVPDKEH